MLVFGIYLSSGCIFQLRVASPRIQVQTVSSADKEPLHMALSTGVMPKLHI